VADASLRSAPGAPIVVVTQSVSTDVNPRARSWIYITEILQRAGLFFEQCSHRSAVRLRRGNAVVLLAGDLPLTAAQREVLAARSAAAARSSASAALD